MKFDQSKMENMIKIQDLQKQIKRANRKRDDEEGEREDEDQYEDYFETQMMKDMEGVESYEQRIDYDQVLEQIQSKVSGIDQSRMDDQL